MPLRAIIAGKDVLAFDLKADEWRSLRMDLRHDRALGRLPCCGAQVVAKTSKLGTQFFAHYVRRRCDAPPETEVHLAAKRAVYEGCIDAGWDAITEAVGPDGTWRADVLASRQRTQVAFEIQWSRQSEERTIERQRGLAKHRVRCCWLFRRLPFDEPTRQIPAFELIAPAGGGPPSVALGPGAHPLREFASMMLQRRIKFCAELIVRFEEVRCRVRRDRCRHCSATIHFADATPPPLPLRSHCGLLLADVKAFSAIQGRYDGWRRELESFHSEDLRLRAPAENIIPHLVLRSPPGKPFFTTLGRNGFCPSCHRIVPFTEATTQLPIAFETRVPVRTPSSFNTPFPHWCLGNNGSYCSDGILQAHAT